jgi:hypothetical protein
LIATMLNDHSARESILILVLEPENLKRMQAADPMTVETKTNHGILDTPAYPDKLRVMIAYEEDDVSLWQLGRGGSIGDMLRYLTRGWKFTKEDGTHQAFKLND